VQAVTTYDLAFSTFFGSGSLQGTLTIDETDPQAKQEIVSGIPSFMVNLSLKQTEGTSISDYSLANYVSVFWQPKTPGVVDFSVDLVPQFSQINFVANVPGPPSACDPWALCSAQSGFSLTSAIPQAPTAVPAPAPLFGAAAAFGARRRLRRRLKNRA